MGRMGRRRGRSVGEETPATEEHRPVSPCAFRLRTVLGRRSRIWIAAMAVMLVPAIANPLAKTRNAGALQGGDGSSLLSVPPRSWAVDAAQNELVALHHKGSYLRYRME